MNVREELLENGWNEDAVDLLLHKHAQQIADQVAEEAESVRYSRLHDGLQHAIDLIRTGAVK